MAMNKAKCSSCNADIYWATTPGGKRIPLDVNPYTIAVFNSDVRKAQGAIDRFVQGYNSHFASCPNAKDHRKEGSSS